MMRILLALALCACGSPNDAEADGVTPIAPTVAVPVAATTQPKKEIEVKTERRVPEPSYRVFPNVADDGEPIGNTGLAIHPLTGDLYHARYDFARSSKIAVRTRFNEEVREHDVSAHLDHIQGMAFSVTGKTLYVWAWRKGVEPKPRTEGSAIFLFTVGDGLRLRWSWDVPAEYGYPGALALSPGVLWLKPNGSKFASGFSLHTDANMTAIDQIDFGVAGEGLTYDGRRGCFWTADAVGVHSHTMRGKRLSTFPNPTIRGSSEGVAVDPMDGAIWLSADEGLHGNHPDGNRVYRIEVRQ